MFNVISTTTTIIITGTIIRVGAG
ncbi:bifunctional aspartokinase I/homoserine dehydrogenase I [Photobacterium profundum 3TCK]|uniref:Bifunctional aspartokinase I/homoserine dehydrogenase I n=1 Tax=Photobacterium profundum 3TCK TaxID=314280 RepID=Q1Z190_9GAMM|nr:bifunctional aspartokinase I/homoserine dehydrogenase I [Photobacterium profundum 3TCK]